MIRVLLVEDSPADARLVREILSEDGGAQFQLNHVDRADRAVEQLRTESYDAVLLDLGLPDVMGLEAAERVMSAAPDMPIVVMSGQSDENMALMAVKNGAQDYLIKGQADGPLIGRAIRYAIERKRSEQFIHHLAHHDGLTGLPNRRLLFDRIQQGLARAHRNNLYMGVMFLDLDNFKGVNDNLGHAAGDELLRAVAQRLRTFVRETDTVARWGGDEFGIVLPEVHSVASLNSLAAKILALFKTPFQASGQDHYVTPSIGISLYPDDAETPEQLIKNADTAMYKAKSVGRSNYQFYSPSMNLRASERLAMGTALRHALNRNELGLHYQPIMSLADGRLTGVEALLRWDHPVFGLKAPGEFIPLAEETGLIVPIGEKVLSMAMAQHADWRRMGLDPGRLAINVSCRQLEHLDFPETVCRYLKESGLPPDMLELELTESCLLSDTEESLHVVEKLSGLGIRVTIDDFGTGYSSLSRLSDMKIDSLKIDQSFVQRLTKGEGVQAITSAIIAMGHALNLNVVAEGVEETEQLDLLKDQNCDGSQGFLLCRPLPADAMKEFLGRPSHWARHLNMVS